MTVAAVVVTYNRIAYLTHCLRALRDQSLPLDEIIVIDNGSTDGTRELLRTQHPDLTIFESDRNLGGAGGFARGVELAIANGHSDAWLMDDDAEPHVDALDELVRVAESGTVEGVRPSFVACTVVDSAGRELISHRTPEREVSVEVTDATYVEWASFVGVLINLDLARHTFLPVSDFFIYYDDVEYTARLSQHSPGLRAKRSLITHPDKSSSRDMGWRLQHDIRNRLWIRRLGHLANDRVRSTIVGRVHRTVVNQAIHSEHKGHYLRRAVAGLYQGLFSRPGLHNPGELDGVSSTRPTTSAT